MSEAESKRVFQMRFNTLLAQRSVSQKEIAGICGVSTSTVSTWSQGLNMPRMDKIEKLANYFGVPKSHFIEESRSFEAAEPSEDEIKAAFLGGLAEDLSPEEINDYWDDARAYLQFKLANRKKKKE